MSGFTRLDEEVLPALLSRTHSFPKTLVVDPWVGAPPPLVTHRPGGCGCGFWGFRFPTPPERVARLPEPATVLGASFLGSRAIEVVMVDRRVRTEDCPEGYFGDWALDGALVTARVSITGETAMRRLFSLLAETVGETEDSAEDYWFDPTEPEVPASDYRRDNRFVADLSFEFVGEPAARVEISLSQQRVLLEVGEKWEAYILDEWSAAALAELTAALAQDGGNL